MAAVLVDAPRRDDRLLVAIACSLALHVALLWLLPGFFEARKKTPEVKALTAQLVAPEPAKAVEPLAQAPLQPAVRPHRATLPKPAPRAREDAPRRVAPVALPVIALPPTPSSLPAALVAPPAPVAPAPAPVAAAAPSAQNSAALAPVASAPDPGSIAQFRMDLIAMAKRHKRYPRAAVDNNWEGKVDLRMVVAANGSIASLNMRKSAGYTALDDEARQMFRAAKAELAIPPALRGREFAVDISADFYFKE